MAKKKVSSRKSTTTKTRAKKKAGPRKSSTPKKGTKKIAAKEKAARESEEPDAARDDRLLTVRDVMALLKLSRTRIWQLVNEDNLPAYKLGGSYRFWRSEVIAWLEQFRVN